jgi:hypothetical protein
LTTIMGTLTTGIKQKRIGFNANTYIKIIKQRRIPRYTRWVSTKLSSVVSKIFDELNSLRGT